MGQSPRHPDSICRLRLFERERLRDKMCVVDVYLERNTVARLETICFVAEYYASLARRGLCHFHRFPGILEIREAPGDEPSERYRGPIICPRCLRSNGGANRQSVPISLLEIAHLIEFAALPRGHIDQFFAPMGRIRVRQFPCPRDRFPVLRTRFNVHRFEGGECRLIDDGGRAPRRPFREDIDTDNRDQCRNQCRGYTYREFPGMALDPRLHRNLLEQLKDEHGANMLVELCQVVVRGDVGPVVTGTRTFVELILHVHETTAVHRIRPTDDPVSIEGIIIIPLARTVSRAELP